MERRSFSEAEKILIARGWSTARDQGISQEAYARHHRTTARRVREFVAEYAPSRSSEHTRAIVVSAIAQLQAVLAQLDCVETTALPDEPARQDAPLVRGEAATPTDERPAFEPSGAPPTATRPRPTFNWDLDDDVVDE